MRQPTDQSAQCFLREVKQSAFAIVPNNHGKLWPNDADQVQQVQRRQSRVYAADPGPNGEQRVHVWVRATKPTLRKSDDAEVVAVKCVVGITGLFGKGSQVSMSVGLFSKITA